VEIWREDDSGVEARGGSRFEEEERARRGLIQAAQADSLCYDGASWRWIGSVARDGS